MLMRASGRSKLERPEASGQDHRLHVGQVVWVGVELYTILKLRDGGNASKRVQLQLYDVNARKSGKKVWKAPVDLQPADALDDDAIVFRCVTPTVLVTTTPRAIWH